MGFHTAFHYDRNQEYSSAATAVAAADSTTVTIGNRVGRSDEWREHFIQAATAAIKLATAASATAAAAQRHQERQRGSTSSSQK
ncbi:hypothetical protein Emag_006515 [Eimeria magna]